MSGFNSKRTGTYGRTNYISLLGRNRAAVGSITRPYNYLARTNTSISPIYTLFNLNTGGSSSPSLDIFVPTPTPITKTLPESPFNLNPITDINQITITFTDGLNGGSDITNYLYSIDNGLTYTSASKNSSPIVISGLTSNTTYNIKLKAVNSIGNGNESRTLTVTTLSTPSSPPTYNSELLAPVITGISFKTTDSFTVTFTQQANGITITNYKYSIDNGNTYTALSPVDITSPITISGLSSNTTYNIKLRATSASGDGIESDVWTESTYANVNFAVFTDVGTTTWTAPDGVTFVQYLVVGGGGGGGSTYSKINVLGDVLVTDIPQPGKYWINSANLTNMRYSGRMYFGTNTYQNSASFTDPIRLTASQNLTPSGVIYDYNKWYGGIELVYELKSALVGTTNWVPPYQINSTQGNNISGGSGGGAGGQVKVLTGTNKYTVVPGSTYTIIVGAGGQGGVGDLNSETNGSPGDNSSFDTIISVGGSGGAASRIMTQIQDTNKNGKGGNGGQGYGNLVGGSGGGQTSSNNYGRYNSAGPGASGSYVNFYNTPTFYGAGGTGGVPNTVATGTTPPNIGKGGSGTGATLNSYANGINGGSGVVIIKYYT
jgi:hypothetical protein